MFVCSDLLKYKFSMASASYKEPVAKVVGGFHRFGPKIIGKPTINKHHVFYYDNSSLFLFAKPVLFIHVWSHLLDYDLILFAKGAKFDGDEFSFIVCSWCLD